MINRIFADFGIYISIIYGENLDRQEAWRFMIHDSSMMLHKSGRIYDYRECQIKAIKKAAEYLEL